LAFVLPKQVFGGPLTRPTNSEQARFIFSALQGALLAKRATGDWTQVRDIITVMKMQLTGGA
jgi:hypothetical protein